MSSPHWRNFTLFNIYPDAEGRIISEPQEDGSSTKTTKQGPADKNKTKAKAGRSKKAGPAAEGGGRQTTAAQVSSM